MKQTKSLSRLMFAGMLCLLVSLLGTTLVPGVASADGTGGSEPPLTAPSTDSLPEGDGGSTAGDSSADLTDETTDTYSALTVVYDLWTLANLL